MATIFNKIINNEISSFKIYEDINYFAFLDINPLAEGHTLVIPKKETDYIFDLEDEEYKGLFLFSKKIAIAIKKVIPCKKVGVAIIGLEVAHAHIHLVPINTIYDLDFKKRKLKLTESQFQEIAKKIQQAI
jgi:histidine triad (HIT) family protein